MESREMGQKSKGRGVQEIMLGLGKHCKDFGLDSSSEMESHLYALLGDTGQTTYFSEH